MNVAAGGGRPCRFATGWLHGTARTAAADCLLLSQRPRHGGNVATTGGVSCASAMPGATCCATLVAKLVGHQAHGSQANWHVEQAGRERWPALSLFRGHIGPARRRLTSAEPF